MSLILNINPNVQGSDTGELLLIRRAAAKDVGAFGELYDRYSIPLYSLVLRIVTNSQEAQDILQRVFLKIWQRASSFDVTQGKLFGWLVTIARNEAIDQIRIKRRQHLIFDDFVLNEIPQGLQTFEQLGSDEATQIRLTVNSLPAEQRRAIELAFFSGVTYQEIARRLGEPLGTVKARIRSGMLILRDKLEPTP